MELIELVIYGVPAFVVFFLFVGRGIFRVADDEVGILTKRMNGPPLPSGRIIATKGEVGIQAKTLTPGLYFRIPIIWSVKKDKMVTISPEEIGVVESIDGQSLPKGRLLGDEIDCNHFQDATRFIEGYEAEDKTLHQGFKGPQIGTLKPGTYRINTFVFNIEKKPVVRIDSNSVGIVVAKDGISLSSKFIISPEPLELADKVKAPSARPHKSFQDGQAFIDSLGYRGPQLQTLQPGSYYINPLLFEVKISPLGNVPAAYVGVVISYVGEDMEKSKDTPSKTSDKPDYNQPIHPEAEKLLMTDNKTRGILRDPIAPGKYNLNTLAYKVILVPTSAVMIDWAAGTDTSLRSRPSTIEDELSDVSAYENVPTYLEKSSTVKAREFYKFSQLRVTSKDGFTLLVDIRLVIRIQPDNAPFVIARFGSVDNLIEQIVHPLIDSSFRNKAGEKEAIGFVQERTPIQQEALLRAREEFAIYHVETQNLLIAYIDTDTALLQTLKDKALALTLQKQYEQQTVAEEKRINVQEMKAKADKQPDVVAAQLEILIQKNRAAAEIQRATGVRQATILQAEGDAKRIELTGEAQAKAYQLQTDVLGADKTAMLKALDEIGVRNIKIVPDILVTGSQGDTSLFSTYMATLMQKSEEDKKEKKTSKNSPQGGVT